MEKSEWRVLRMKIEEILFEQVTKENKDRLEELKAKLNSQQGNWMMCLGAGVSISVGLPNWYKLLAQISARILPSADCEILANNEQSKNYYEGVKKFYENLPENNTFWGKLEDAYKGGYKETFSNINVLEAAEYVKNSLYRMSGYSEDNEKMQKGNLRKKVDAQMNFLIKQACSIDITEKDLKRKWENSTLAAVAGLMRSKKFKDQLIHNVITYNYDNLLETYLRSVCKCNSKKVHSIIKKDELRDFGDNKEWNIYHVHGRIPVIPYDGEEMSDSVILAESDYYKEEQINYSWTNILQSYAILRANLIFIGFSGSDYNFRRIIKYVNQENSISQERYIFFSVDDIVQAVFTNEFKEGKKLEECIDDMNGNNNSKYKFEKFFINYLIQAQTMYWEQHGLKVIWSSHEEIFTHLNSLHK